ncbi:hypothetical protein DFH28DRAFT_923786 [Melampsora americana]|nr:hypothetical protein DFH28DRAFT_923786 [Melampsora americana]
MQKPFSHIELDSLDEENEDKEEDLQIEIDNNDDNNGDVDLPEPDNIFHSEDDNIFLSEDEATTTKDKQSNAKEIDNISISNNQTEDAPLGRELEDMIQSEDEVPLASIKAPKAKRPRGRPAKRRQEPPKELEIAPPKASTTTKTKRPRAKPAKRTTEDTEDTMEKMGLDKLASASAAKPPEKKLKGWKGWAIVEEEDLEKEEGVDDVNDDADGNSDGGGIKLRPQSVRGRDCI